MSITPTQTLLTVEHVSVDYGTGNGAVHAVDDVSFSMERGQIFGLAGESGSGKSTLAYAIARLSQPPAHITGGSVKFYPKASSIAENDLTVEGQDLDQTQALDVFHLTPAQLRAFRWNQLAVVFQSAMNALNPVLDVGTQINDALAAHRPNMTAHERAARAEELVRMVGIAPDRLRSFPHELSGGMRQRAVIAIALALDPDLVIMDEPTTALDVVVQREILTEIIGLRDRLGFSVIFITHDLSLLLEIADAVAIMYAGRIVERGGRGTLYTKPRHPYTHGLLHSFPSLHGPRRELHGIPGSPPDLRSVPPGCPFHPRCAYAFGPCPTVEPVLVQPEGADPGQEVACHLYDPALNPAGVPEALRPRATSAQRGAAGTSGGAQ